MASFKLYVQGVVTVLQDRIQRLQAAAANYSPRSGEGTEGDGGKASPIGETEELLSAVLSAQLVLCRIRLFYGWRPLRFSGDIPTLLHLETHDLAGELVRAWELLGVWGETRRQMLQRLIVVVGQQTLDTRQRINKDHHEQLKAESGNAGETRRFAALRETEGEQRKPPASGKSAFSAKAVAAQYDACSSQGTYRTVPGRVLVYGCTA